MKFVVGENGRKTYPDPVSSTTKPTWSDRDANSGPQRWEACATRPHYYYYNNNHNHCAPMVSTFQKVDSNHASICFHLSMFFSLFISFQSHSPFYRFLLSWSNYILHNLPLDPICCSYQYPITVFTCSICYYFFN